MRALILLAATTAFSIAANGSETDKCFNNSRLKERKEMMSSLASQKYESFEKQFKSLCEKYQDKLDCKIEKVQAGKDSARALELVKGDKCSEVHHVPSKDSVSLYFLTDKSRPLN